MNIKPLHNDSDYQTVMNELMKLEAYGIYEPTELFYIEIMAELIEAYQAQHDVTTWYRNHKAYLFKKH